MTCVTAGSTFGKGNVNLCHRFFCCNVIFPTAINFCVLMEAIPDSTSVFGLIIAVFFHKLKKPFSRLNVGCLLIVYDITNLYCLK